MKIDFSYQPSVEGIFRAVALDGGDAVTDAIHQAGDDLKWAWRRQIGGVLGDRFSRTIKVKKFPRGRRSLGAAALVYSTSPDVLSAHDRGATIRARSGKWLAIPTPAAGRGPRGGRITPLEWRERSGLDLRLIRRPGRSSLLVADRVRLTKRGVAVESRSKTGRGWATAIIFVLVPQVRLKKALDLQRDVDRIGAEIPDRIARAWVDRRAAESRLGGRVQL